MDLSRVLALDLGARNLGWAAQAGDRITYGLVQMPGIKDLGHLYVCARTVYEDLIAAHDPERILFVRGFVGQGRTSVDVGRSIQGLDAILLMVAEDNGIPTPLNVDERRARKLVLGRGDFGKKDANGFLVPNGGREAAKEAVLTWCESRGFRPLSHDVGDALVLLHWCMKEEKRPWP